MATYTLTLTEHTKCNTNSLTIRSHSAKPNNGQKQEVKDIGNSELDVVPSTSRTSEHPGIQKQLSQPETDGGEGSTQSFTSDLITGSSIEFNETDAIGAINLNGGNTTHPQSAQPDSNPTQPDDNPAQPAMIGRSVHPPVFIVPKMPLPQTYRAPPRPSVSTLTRSRPILLHNTLHLEPESRPIIAFQEDGVVNVTQTADIGTDGPQSSLETANTDGSTSTQTHSNISASVESSQCTGGMSDFVILHTNEDTEAACVYKEHLHQDTGIADLTVDLFSNVDLGRSEMMCLSTLHDNYRYILTYVTDNLTSDRYTRFLQEILIKHGLQAGNGKEDRVVPVLTRNEQNDDCRIMELSILLSLQYYRFQSPNRLLKQCYIDSVRKLVKAGRKKFV